MKPPIYYPVAIKLAKPIYRLLLSVRSEKRDSVGVVSLADEFAMRYARQFPEKIPNPEKKPCIWVHAVSLGETNTIAPLLEKLLAQGFHLVVTNTTHTGFAQVKKRFAGRVDYSFIPIDNPKQIAKFLAYYKPQLACFVETELWANTLYVLKKQGIASVLLNARLSGGSYANYAKFGKLAQSMMANLSHIICQEKASASLFEKLGASKEKISLAPSLKFAVSAPKGIEAKAEVLRQDWQLQNQHIILAASTHAGEEIAVLTALKNLQQSYSDASDDLHNDSKIDLNNVVLIIVPRHPERFEEVAKTIEDMGFELRRRSDDDVIASTNHKNKTANTAHTDNTKNTPQVYLADTMGELMLWYALADMALVGGSLVAGIGGHNPLEASISGTAVMMGPFTHKCQILVDILKSKDAISVVKNQQALETQIQTWLNQPELAKASAKAGLVVMQENANAVEKQMQALKPFLPL